MIKPIDYKKLIFDELQKHVCISNINPGGAGVYFVKYGHYQLLTNGQDFDKTAYDELMAFIRSKR